MTDKPITIEDYKDGVADEFFAKYHYIAQELGETPRAEDVLKVMENLAQQVIKKRTEEKKASIGFNKNND